MMRSLSKKRMIRFSVLFVLVALILFIDTQMRQALMVPSYFTGWIMFSLMLILVLFNARKKITFLPLGRAYTWAQFHIYGGLLLFIISFAHVNFAMPNGTLESTLSLMFLLVALSGIYGTYLSRRLPAKMAQQSEYVIYERLPGIREKIREEVEERVNTAIAELGSVAIADFYSKHLYDYLSRPANFWLHFIGREKRVHTRWQSRFQALRLYLNDKEKLLLSEIEQLTLNKTDLDSQYTYRSMLKYWLFFHIPLSYILFVFVLMHLFLVHSFSWSGS